MPGLRQLTDAIHASDVLCPAHLVTPRLLTDDKIARIVAAFGMAGRCAREAVSTKGTRRLGAPAERKTCTSPKAMLVADVDLPTPLLWFARTSVRVMLGSPFVQTDGSLQSEHG